MDMFESPPTPSTDSRPIVTAVFELPGLCKEDVQIEFVEGNMIITGARNHFKGIDKEDNEVNKVEQTKMEDDADNSSATQGSYTVREIKRGRFRRIIPLPPSVQVTNSRFHIVIVSSFLPPFDIAL